MKKSLTILILVVTLVFTSCNKDDAAKAVILQSDEYTIFDVANSGITGKATFTQEDNGSTHVLIELKVLILLKIQPIFDLTVQPKEAQLQSH